MSTLRKIAPFRLTLIAVILLVLVAGVILRYSAWAQTTESLNGSGPVIGSGDGLLGSYFNNRHLWGFPVMNRVDSEINWNFEVSTQLSLPAFTNQCMALLGMPKDDEFGIRWIGELQAQYTATYTIYAHVNDGIRVWLNEQLIINDWNSHVSRDDTAAVNLVAGQRYLLRVEYFQNHGDSQVQLSWSSPSTAKEIIPQSQLYSQPTDSDGNGLPDLWEEHYFGHIGVDPNGDPDNDGLSNLREYQRRSDPTNPLNWNIPNDWTHGDIDNRSASDQSEGDASYSNGVFTVSSIGRQIWQLVDDFHYVYRPIGTNGEMVIRVLGMTGINPGATAGLMVRETLDHSSRNAMLSLSQNNFVSFQSRAFVDAETIKNQMQTNAVSPVWLKLVRNNDWVGGYVSGDGTNWVLFDWDIIQGLSQQAFIGMAVCADSHKGTRSPTVAQFDDVIVGPAPTNDVLNPATGSGDGLLGTYRNDSLLYMPGLTNVVDQKIEFNWVHETAFPKLLNPDDYGVCWSGEIQAEFTEPYTFNLQCRPQDWVRMWVNDRLVVNGWRQLNPKINYTGTVNMVAGHHYLVRVEMFNNHDKGSARLKWESPSTPLRVVPQRQLYSQAADSDGNGLPDIWEKIYFGHIGVDPNADPDGDGLSNLQEYRYHTDPTKADTDGDGIPDAWEIAHGLDPQYPDANLDYNNSGYSNLQDYQYGLDPFNLDVNNNGLPDSFEVTYLGLSLNQPNSNLTHVAAMVYGAQATNLLGNWATNGNDIYAIDRRGGMDFILAVTNSDKYVLDIYGTQNQPNPYATQFKLLLGIDGQTLGHYTLNAGYGTNGEVCLVLPFLKAGNHTVHVFWDGVASFSSLRIEQVEFLSVSGADANANGIKDWADNMMAAQSGLDSTNAIIGSYTSPACLEGRDSYPAMVQVTDNGTNTLAVAGTTDGRWYINAPLLATTQTPFQISYQNGGLIEARELQWRAINLLTVTNNFTIRRGDSLLFNALPTNGVNGTLQLTVGTNSYTGTTAKAVPYKFATAGTYTVTGSYTPAGGGATQSGSITVDVVQQNLPSIQPAAWTWMLRALVLPAFAPEATLQADSRLPCFISGTNGNGGIQLTLGTDANEPRSIIARIGTNGPVLASTQVSGFDVWSGEQAYTKVLQVYPDGSQLVEMLLISSPVETNVTFVIEPIVSGVIFEDGTTVKTLTATNFDALGQYPVRFIRPAAVHTSVCNAIKAYQGNYQLGYRH